MNVANSTQIYSSEVKQIATATTRKTKKEERNEKRTFLISRNNIPCGTLLYCLYGL